MAKELNKKELINDITTEVMNKVNEAIKETKPVKTLDMFISPLKLDETVNNILKVSKKNEKLTAFCESYKRALDSGQHGELLYESFINGASSWSYLNAVDTELSALADRVKKYKQEIDLTKILRAMEDTNSFQIVPLIEGSVVDYMEDKNPTTRSVLMSVLAPFQYDPFVKDIINTVTTDRSKDSIYLGESIESLNSKVRTEPVYSPVQYIKENECIFNVKGTYYNRKGNNITKLDRESVAKLNESFRYLCDLVNNHMVTINESEILYYNDNYKVSISNSGVKVNNKLMTESDLSSLAETMYYMGESDGSFIKNINMLNENFNNIAKIDFVKHLVMNESFMGKNNSADIFRIKNNLFVATQDNVNGKRTFYRNINPIQTCNIINEHMELNVSKLFEDILPNQDKIKGEIKDTLSEYENYIADLEEKLKDFENMDSVDDKETAKEAIDIINKELENIKKDYSEYQKISAPYTEDVEIKTDDIEDVDNYKGEYGFDMPDMDEPDENAFIVEPDEFGSDGLEDELGLNPESVDDLSVSVDDGPEHYENETLTPEVIKVVFNQNIVTGEKYNNGYVYLINPIVDSNGDVIQDFKAIEFNIEDGAIKIDLGQTLPAAEYKLVTDAISNEPNVSNILRQSPADLGIIEPVDDIETVVDTEDKFAIAANPDAATRKGPDNKTDITMQLNSSDIDEGIFVNSNKKVNESKITIEDKNGQRIEIDTDDLGDRKKKSADLPDHNNDVTTFNLEDSRLYSDEDEKDEDEKDEDEKDEDEKDEDNNRDEKEDKDKEEKDEKKEKITFKFRPKKLGESFVVVSYDKLNEGATPNVMDKVSYKGQNGQIISVLANGDYILELQGKTQIATPSQIKLVSKKKDTVEAPFKYDPKTLKGIYESYVNCGIYMNNTLVSPVGSCTVKYSDYKKAKPTDNISIIYEGDTSKIEKQYVKLFEDIEDQWIDGYVINPETGESLYPVFINSLDYSSAIYDESEVRIVKDDGTSDNYIEVEIKKNIKPLSV